MLPGDSGGPRDSAVQETGVPQEREESRHCDAAGHYGDPKMVESRRPWCTQTVVSRPRVCSGDGGVMRLAQCAE